jgi:hypothetical protein
MHHRNFIFAVVACLGMLVFVGTANADTVPDVESAGSGTISFSLSEADLTGTPGSVLTWEYHVVNNSGEGMSALDVNAGSWTGGMPNAGAFDLFGGMDVPDGGSVSGVLYSFLSDPLVTISSNSGTFDLEVILDDGEIIDLFQGYTATIPPPSVAEPSSLLLLVSAFLGLLALRKLS